MRGNGGGGMLLRSGAVEVAFGLGSEPSCCSSCRIVFSNLKFVVLAFLFQVTCTFHCSDVVRLRVFGMSDGCISNRFKHRIVDKF